MPKIKQGGMGSHDTDSEIPRGNDIPTAGHAEHGVSETPGGSVKQYDGGFVTEERFIMLSEAVKNLADKVNGLEAAIELASKTQGDFNQDILWTKKQLAQALGKIELLSRKVG